MYGRLLLIYGAAHFGKSLLWTCSILTFAFYLTEVAGVAPAFMGLIVGSSLALNACCDLFNGWWLARRVASLQSAALAQAIGASLAATAFVAFSATSFLPETSRLAAAFLGLVLFRFSYSLFDVPQNAMMALGTVDNAQRTRIAAIRYAAAGLALLSVTLTISGWLQIDDYATRARSFFVFAIVMAAVAFSTSIGLLMAVRGLQQKPANRAQPATQTDAWAPPFALALFSVLAFSGLAPFFTKLEAYFVTFVLPDGSVKYFMVSVAVGQVTSQAVWGRLGARLPLMTLYRVAAAALIVVMLAFLALAGSGPVILLALGFLYGAAFSGLLMTIWSVLAASSRDPARTTFRFGQFTFCSKLAHAIAATSIGLLLQSFDYAAEANRQLLLYIMAAGPLLAGCVCLVLSGIFAAPFSKSWSTNGP